MQFDYSFARHDLNLRPGLVQAVLAPDVGWQG
jgi:hypothetical protein